eukprot:snap_masked-scaffold_25-processed-gene-5.35-mRNA-1 protein AED:0.15 eAED:0.38 QI:0/-1/0/1/-1/1/1/0/169
MPVTKRGGKQWFVEDYGKQGDKRALEEVEVKTRLSEPVNAFNCYYTKIVVPEKCLSVSLVGCHNCTLLVSDVVASVQVTNCKDIVVEMQKTVNSVQVDKTDGLLVDASGPNVDATAVTVIAAKSSELNISYSLNGTKLEKPLPEQFTYKLVPDGADFKVLPEVSELYSS